MSWCNMILITDMSINHLFFFIWILLQKICLFLFIFTLKLSFKKVFQALHAEATAFQDPHLKIFTPHSHNKDSSLVLTFP